MQTRLLQFRLVVGLRRCRIGLTPVELVYETKRIQQQQQQQQPQKQQIQQTKNNQKSNEYETTDNLCALNWPYIKTDLSYTFTHIHINTDTHTNTHTQTYKHEHTNTNTQSQNTQNICTIIDNKRKTHTHTHIYEYRVPNFVYRVYVPLLSEIPRPLLPTKSNLYLHPMPRLLLHCAPGAQIRSQSYRSCCDQQQQRTQMSQPDIQQ